MSDVFRTEIDLTLGRVVIRVLGDIDVANCSQLCEVLELNQARTTVVDLSGTAFMDSSGLAALILARKAIDDMGGSFTIRRPSKSVRLLLERSGLEFLLADERHNSR
jgi:anti-sigma B factor antagonist